MTVAGGISLYHQRLEQKKELKKDAEKRRAEVLFLQRLERGRGQAREVKEWKVQRAKRASEHNPITRLLSLPGEIRNLIYTMVFYDEAGSERRHYASILPEMCASAGIVRTCKQLRAEGRSHFIGQCNILAVQCPTPVAFIHSNKPFTSINQFPHLWRSELDTSLPQWLLEQPREVFYHSRQLQLHFPVIHQVRYMDDLGTHFLGVFAVIKGNTYGCHVYNDDYFCPILDESRETLVATANELRAGTLAFFADMIKAQPGQASRDFQLLHDHPLDFDSYYEYHADISPWSLSRWTTMLA